MTRKAEAKVPKMVLVGNPNCGKTTLFNSLTGQHQKTGNWSGVTVDKKEGLWSLGPNLPVKLIDLPGLFSLISHDASSSIDERLGAEYLVSQPVDVVFNVIDVTQLERSLYLSLQLLELGLPVIVVLTFNDVLSKQNQTVDLGALSDALGCPVVAVNPKVDTHFEALKQALETQKETALNHWVHSIPKDIETSIDALTNEWCQSDHFCHQPLRFEARHEVLQWLEGKTPPDPYWAQRVEEENAHLKSRLGFDADILLAQHRYQIIETIVQRVCQPLEHSRSKQSPAHKPWSQRLDTVLLSRVFGLPIFLGIMYSLFVFAIQFGGIFQEFFDQSSQALFVEGLAYQLVQWDVPNVWVSILAYGLGKGLNTTLSFIPVLGAMFFALSFLEMSGYMARAAFLMDRLMRAIGLPGKSFVPMIIGFGCNVPAILGARTLEHHNDRVMTVLMSPFMSCGARLAIFTVFASVFFPRDGQNVIFLLYLIGGIMAISTGILLKKTLLKSNLSPLVFELPAYQVPSLKVLWAQSWHRLKLFILNAGKLIVPLCMCLGFLNAWQWKASSEETPLSWVGKQITPIFSPMGISEDNWPATVGLLTGVLAKEVVVGTLNTLYSQEVDRGSQGKHEDFDLGASLKEAVYSIGDHFSQVNHLFLGALEQDASAEMLDDIPLGIMENQFDGKVGAFAYLLFVLLYFPCVSAIAAMVKEVKWGWACFSVLWSTGLAYGGAVIFYQLATLGRHPVSSILWVTAVLSAAFILYKGLCQFQQKHQKTRRLPTPIALA